MTASVLPLVVTTSGKLGRRGDTADAEATARRLGAPFVPYQRNVPVRTLLDTARAVLELSGEGVTLVDREGETTWSPGMAALRARRLEDGVEQPDGILVAGEIREGDAVVDCTLGLAHDAWVLAQAVGPAGRVVGVEASLPLFALTSEGLRRAAPNPRACAIACHQAPALDFLRAQPSASVDVVYFDPMFSKHAKANPAFSILRRHAERTPPTVELIEEAARVCRRGVVVKAAPNSADFAALGIDALPFKRTADLRFARVAAGWRRRAR